MVKKIEVFQIYDLDTNELIEEFENLFECYGQRVRLIGEMCGGCAKCLAQQAHHYGSKVVTIEREVK